MACSGGSGLLESQENKVFCCAAFYSSASEEMKSFIAFSWAVFMMHLPCQDFLESLIRKGHVGSLISLMSSLMVEQFLGGVSGLGWGEVT